MTEADLDAIRQRVEAATPGPWIQGTMAHLIIGGTLQEEIVACWNVREKNSLAQSFAQATNNANFIANARTDIPQLLAAIDERDKVIHDMMEESDARRLAQRYRDVIKAVKYLIRGWRGESSIAERIVFKLIDEALEDNP